jgi:hypothetical protein
VALLIDGLRYGATAPATNSSTGSDARNLCRGVALRRSALVDAARWEGLDVLTPETRPEDGHDVTDH